jgi:hypothetical protein
MIMCPTSTWFVFGGSGAGVLPSDLVDAVVARLQSLLVSSGQLTWFGTGRDPGASTAPMPYGVMAEPDEDDDDLNTSGDRMAQGHLEIHFYAPTKKLARSLGDQAEASLKDAPLLFSAGWLVYLRQSGRMADLDPDRAPDGSSVWDEMRQFRFMYSYA